MSSVFSVKCNQLTHIKQELEALNYNSPGHGNDDDKFGMNSQTFHGTSFNSHDKKLSKSSDCCKNSGTRSITSIKGQRSDESKCAYRKPMPQRMFWDFVSWSVELNIQFLWTFILEDWNVVLILIVRSICMFYDLIKQFQPELPIQKREKKLLLFISLFVSM